MIAAEQHHQFVPAPARILASQGQGGFGLRGCPGGLSKRVRAMRVALEAGEVVGIHRICMATLYPRVSPIILNKNTGGAPLRRVQHQDEIR